MGILKDIFDRPIVTEDILADIILPEVASDEDLFDTDESNPVASAKTQESAGDAVATGDTAGTR